MTHKPAPPQPRRSQKHPPIHPTLHQPQPTLSPPQPEQPIASQDLYPTRQHHQCRPTRLTQPGQPIRVQNIDPTRLHRPTRPTQALQTNPARPTTSQKRETSRTTRPTRPPTYQAKTNPYQQRPTHPGSNPTEKCQAQFKVRFKESKTME